MFDCLLIEFGLFDDKFEFLEAILSRNSYDAVTEKGATLYIDPAEFSDKPELIQMYQAVVFGSLHATAGQVMDPCDFYCGPGQDWCFKLPSSRITQKRKVTYV